MTMFASINEIAILGCTLLLLALYVLWYSLFPTLGGKEQEGRRLVMAGISFLMLSALIAYGVAFSERVGLSPWMFALVAALFAATLRVPSALQESGSFRTHLIHGIFISGACFLATITLAYWPW